jgi:cytosine-specific methyltransferase
VGHEKSFDTYRTYIFKKGLFARQFPIKSEAVIRRTHFNKLADDIAEISDAFKDGMMWNSGVMRMVIFIQLIQHH